MGYDPFEVAFVMEHTGHYGYGVASFLDDHDMFYTFVSGLEVKRHFPLSRIKNDKNDSKKIAQYFYEVQERPDFQIQKIKAREIYTLSILLSERTIYIKQRAQLKTQRTEEQLYGTANRKRRLEASIKSLSAQIRDVEMEIENLIEKTPEIKANYDLITGIAGIGLITAVTIIVATCNFKSGRSARQFAMFVCVAPCDDSSGTSVKRGFHTSNQGRKDIKSLLSRSVLMAIKKDVGIRKYYERKREEGKHYYCIANAIMFKIICRIFAVVKRGTPYVETMKYCQ